MAQLRNKILKEIKKCIGNDHELLNVFRIIPFRLINKRKWKRLLIAYFKSFI